MFNPEELYRVLKEHRMSVPDLAKYLGINKTTLYRKIDRESDFVLGEIQKCRELFGSEAATMIFFADEVA